MVAMEKPHKILVVDDTPANLALLLKLLRGEGYRVFVVESGERALAQVAFINPDLILLDVQMPGLNGFETCAQLKRNVTTAVIPVIFLTVEGDLQQKVRGFEVGGVDYILKPFSDAEVLARVHTHLTLFALQQQLASQNTWLSEQVKARTASLQDVNAALQTEISQRRRHEQEKDKLFTLIENQNGQLRDLTNWLLNGLPQQASQQLLPPQLRQQREESGGETAVLNSLSQREVDVLKLLADGYNNSQMAERLNVSEVTVRTYRTRLMKKLDIHHLAGLVKFAIRHQLTAL